MSRWAGTAGGGGAPVVGAVVEVEGSGRLPDGLVAGHIRDLVLKTQAQGTRLLDQTLLLRGLAIRLRGSNGFGGFASDTLMKLGLVGTIISLFTGLSSDPSIAGRTDDYAVVGKFISESPWFGRGFGTFLPKEYFILDNQYLGSIVETGYVGLGALLAGLRTALGQAWMAVVASEIFGVPGLGQRMMQAANLLASDVVVVYMATMAALYGMIDTGFVALQSWLLRWKR